MRHLVKLRGVLDVNLERDARVLPLFPCGTLKHILVSLTQTTGNRLANVAHEALLVDANNLEVETAWVLLCESVTPASQVRAKEQRRRFCFSWGVRVLVSLKKLQSVSLTDLYFRAL